MGLPLLKSRIRTCGFFSIEVLSSGHPDTLSQTAPKSHLFLNVVLHILFCRSRFSALLAKTFRYSALFDHTEHFKNILSCCYGYISVAVCLGILFTPKTNSLYVTKCSDIKISQLLFLANNKYHFKLAR